jgi:hypothetical protein
MKMKQPVRSLLLFVVALLFNTLSAQAEVSDKDKQFYRELVLKIRMQAEFTVPMPANGDMHFDYKLEFDQPKWKEPLVSETTVKDGDLNPSGKVVRDFWDKVFLKEGSYLNVGGEQIPLTCIHVAGQDNRFSGKSGPLFPDLILKIIFVANDWTCQGPINPGWPGNGAKKEAWDTYIHYVVKDPTIMLPVDAGLRYRWNEFEAVLVK